MRFAAVLTLLVIIVVLASQCGLKTNPSQQSAIPDIVSYNFHIRPLLSDKCFACHGPDAKKRAAGLRLDLPEAAFAPLKETPGKFALVAGHPELSELLNRITSSDTAYQMPPPETHLGALNVFEIALFKKWILQGAKYEKHWAFTPPVKAELPAVKHTSWPKLPLDYFVLAAMEQKGLSPNEPADAYRLLKRIAIDITGLPPSDDLTAFFLNDPEKNYEKTIDALLASPHFGEKMALHWCDVGRYADSYGYQDDNIRTQWPWRDWVIYAFNKNLPYNTFLQWQIAGDMLPNATKEQILATAFFRNHKYTEEGGVVPEEYRIEYLLDKVKTYSKGLLALTVECAQCHDHKYDPFSQKDYYQLLAFFNSTKEVGFEGDVSVSKPAKTPILSISNTEKRSFLDFLNKRDTGMLTISVMGEADTVRKTYLLNRGAYDQPGAEVRPAALPAILTFDTTKFPRNRLGLALWTIDNRNPVTARVWVNRVWQEIFGKGLVKTTGDFGMQGVLPSHPELLDWLAVDFMEHGWDTKRLIKLLLMSATYRQSAKTTQQHLAIDPENIYWSRSPRIRLKAELIRDWVLATSGLLQPTIGGPSVKPYQPKGLWESATSGRGVLATYKQDKGENLYRRGLYTFIKLTVPPPSMVMFDASNRDQCEVQRLPTNTPLQALVMMNDPVVLEAARVMAQNSMAKNFEYGRQIKTAFVKIVGRQPSKSEGELLNNYYKEQLNAFENGKLSAEKTLQVGEYPQSNKVSPIATAALMKVLLMVFNLDEVITKN